MSYNLQQLSLFTTIVSCGGLGRAASALHLTQPALSRSLKRLEAQVGAPLFERHMKGMELTATGRALLPHAMLLQREAEHAREEIDAMRGLAKGTIKVGAVGSNRELDPAAGRGPGARQVAKLARGDHGRRVGSAGRRAADA